MRYPYRVGVDGLYHARFEVYEDATGAIVPAGQACDLLTLGHELACLVVEADGPGGTDSPIAAKARAYLAREHDEAGTLSKGPQA